MKTTKILLYSGLAIAAVWGISKLIKKDDAPVKKEASAEEDSNFLGFSFGKKKTPVLRTRPTTNGECPAGWKLGANGTYCVMQTNKKQKW